LGRFHIRALLTPLVEEFIKAEKAGKGVFGDKAMEDA